jgi:hypothetical protein
MDRPTQLSLKPLIQSHAEWYVTALANLHQEKINSFRVNLAYFIILSIVTWINILPETDLIHIPASIVTGILGIYCIQKSKESHRESKEIGQHYEIMSGWLKGNHPAIVCQDAYGKYCLGIDRSLKEEARANGYDDRELVASLYRREMDASKIFQ